MSAVNTIPFLTPTNVDGEINDALLQDQLQAVVVGLTGMDGTLVFPRSQQNPPDMPDLDITWAAIGISKKSRWTFAFSNHYPSQVGNQPSTSRVIREEDLWALASFFGPTADAMSETFSMGFQLAQNRQAMQQLGLSFIEAMDVIPRPDMTNEQNRLAYDIEFRLRRRQSYTYVVNEFISVGVVITLDDPTQSFTVTVEPAQ
jgi:hypothetical protein